MTTTIHVNIATIYNHSLEWSPSPPSTREVIPEPSPPPSVMSDLDTTEGEKVLTQG